jgi:hypothetical protein
MPCNVIQNYQKIRTLLLSENSEGAELRQSKRRLQGKTENEEDALAKFVSLVDVKNECRHWIGQLNQYGYGRMSFLGKHAQRAHRVSYLLFVGEIPDGLCVCHHCDNPSCVNPDHLFLGTKDDNNKDKCRKGRQPIGNIHWNRKLTVDQVKQFRYKFELLDLLPTREEAEALGVSLVYLKQVAQGTERIYVE